MEELAGFNKELRAIRKKAETSTGIPKLQTAVSAHTRKAGMVEPFRRLEQPEVKKRAQEWLFTLLRKHAAKMEAKSPVNKVRYKASLIAVATHMAMRDFGLIISCKDARKKGTRKRNYSSFLQVMMGIKDARSTTSMQE